MTKKATKRALLNELDELERNARNIHGWHLFYYSHEVRYDDVPYCPSDGGICAILDRAEREVNEYIERRTKEIKEQMEDL